jgi:hypothetical protein
MLALIDAAATAYQRARIQVYDRLESGQRVDTTWLCPQQREALALLDAAETELAELRTQRYDTTGPPEPLEAGRPQRLLGPVCGVELAVPLDDDRHRVR